MMRVTVEMTVDLGSGAALRLGSGLRGQVLRCVSGVLWMTQEGDGRDFLLLPGQEQLLESDGLVILQALRPSQALLYAPVISRVRPGARKAI